MSISRTLSMLYYNCKHTNFSKDELDTAFNLITCNMTMIIRFVKYQQLDCNYIQRILDSNICKSERNKRILLNNAARNQRLDKEFIHSHLERFSHNNYDTLIRNQEMGEESIVIIINADNADSVVTYQNLTERIIIDNIDILSTKLVCMCQPLSEEFIEEVGTVKNGGWIDLSLVGQTRLYTTSFMIKYLNIEEELMNGKSTHFLSIENIVKYQNMDCKLIEYVLASLNKCKKNYFTRVCKIVESMSWRQSIPSDIIKKYINLWTKNSTAVEELLIYQILSEDLILHMANTGLITESGWRFLSRNQKLSSSIFHKFRNQIHRCVNSVEELRKYSGARTVSKKRAGIDNNIVNKIFEFM